MELARFAGTPQARRAFLVALALALGNTPEQASEKARVFLVAVGTPTRAERTEALLTLPLPEVSQAQALAAEWARDFLRKAELPRGKVSHEHAPTIGRFLFLIVYSERLDPCPGDETMSWYEALVHHIGSVWGADSDAFLAHVTAACREADTGGL